MFHRNERIPSLPPPLSEPPESAVRVFLAVDRPEQTLEDLLRPDRGQFQDVNIQPGPFVGADALAASRIRFIPARQIQPEEGRRVARAQTHVGHRRLPFEPERIVGQRVRHLTAGQAGVVEREHVKLRVPLEHRADGLERPRRIAADRQHRAAVLEVKVVGQQEIDRAGPVANHGAVERVVADVGLLRPRDSRARLPDDQSRRVAVGRDPALPHPVERRLIELHQARPSVAPQQPPDAQPRREQDGTLRQQPQHGQGHHQEHTQHNGDAPRVHALAQAAAQLVVEMLDAPSDLAVGGDRVDGGLETGVGEAIAVFRLEGESLAARATAVGTFAELAVLPAIDALHSGPRGWRPRPSTKTRIHASSIASVHSRSPMRRRRVSRASFCPCRSRSTMPG